MVRLNAWVELTPWELAYLADAPLDRPNLLDRVSTAGEWLRNPGARALGERLFAERIERTPEVTGPGWALVAGAASAFAQAQRGAMLSLRGDTDLLLAVAGPVQVAIRPQGVGIRVTEDGCTPAALAAELTEVVVPQTAVVGRWLGGDRTSWTQWADGRLESEQGVRDLDREHAVLWLCELVLAPVTFRSAPPVDAGS